MIKLLWKYFIPVVLVFFGFTVLAGDAGQPYSATVPIVLGSYQTIVGSGLLLAGVLVALAIYRYPVERK